VVTDDQGVPWLQQTGQAATSQRESKRQASRARHHRSSSLR
jgi:hypothetical protein